VGIGIEDFFDHMVGNVKFDREAGRTTEFEVVVARVSARRSKPSRTNSGEGAAAEAVMGAMAARILKSDDLIREKRFKEARSILDDVLAGEPNNARALYGMAQVVTQTPSATELDSKADENDKIQMQHDRLERAIKLYQRAIENASTDTERWLIQWSHLFLGRIYDFQEFREDAIAEYEIAIALGEVPNGAYKEALEGKRRPYGQK
jgi:tetratricopeptide (TPR) repeat protein